MYSFSVHPLVESGLLNSGSVIQTLVSPTSDHFSRTSFFFSFTLNFKLVRQKRFMAVFPSTVFSLFSYHLFCCLSSAHPPSFFQSHCPLSSPLSLSASPPSLPSPLVASSAFLYSVHLSLSCRKKLQYLWCFPSFEATVRNRKAIRLEHFLLKGKTVLPSSHETTPDILGSAHRVIPIFPKITLLTCV